MLHLLGVELYITHNIGTNHLVTFYNFINFLIIFCIFNWNQLYFKIKLRTLTLNRLEINSFLMRFWKLHCNKIAYIKPNSESTRIFWNAMLINSAIKEIAKFFLLIIVHSKPSIRNHELDILTAILIGYQTNLNLNISFHSKLTSIRNQIY